MKIVGPVGETLTFFKPLGFGIWSTFDHKTSKLKFCLDRAFIWYLKDKNLAHDQETPISF